MARESSLRHLLAPRSIAIIGASDNPTRIGGRPLRYLLGAGYEGELFPVNPKRDTTQGVRSYPNIGAIDQPVDCAIVSVPADAAVEAVRECANAGVRSAIVFSAGFAEIGGVGSARQDELRSIAHETGMRILGPNTVGAVNTAQNIYQTFSMATEQATGRVGRVGMATQSGGYGSYFLHLSRRQGLSLGQWVATGNECDVEIGEVLQYFAEDPGIDVLMGYIEGIRSRDTFIRALETARRNGKPVVMLKVGSSAAGVQAAASHTAALAGSDEIYDAVFREFGVHRAHGPEEFLDVAYAASQGKFPTSRSVAVLTTSGGMGVHAADYLEEAGLELPALTEVIQEKLLRLAPFGAATNPVDTTAQFVNTPKVLDDMLRIVLDEGGFDTALILLAHAAVSPDIAGRLLEALSLLTDDYPNKLLAIAMAAPPDVLEQFRAAGYLVFEDLGRAAIALGALRRFGDSFAREDAQAPAAPPVPAELEIAGALNEAAAKKLLAAIGIKSPPERVAMTPDEAADCAADLGFPIVLKILSADIAHKTEVGGVVVDLQDAAAVRRAAVKMLETVVERAPHAHVDGLLVSKMTTGGTECIVGTVKDPIFGPVAMFGLGGVSVEVFGDVTFRLAPVSKTEAVRMVREIRGLQLLEGHRGKPAADIEALADVVVSLSGLAVSQADAIRSIEINPLLAMPRGEGAYALDAAFVPEDRKG